MKKSFTVEQYKDELGQTNRRTAKRGWDYLVGQGVTESEIFQAVRLPVSGELEQLQKQSAV